MFAYCRNNPVNRKDSDGMSDENVKDDESQNNTENFLKWFLSHMSRQRKDGHTFSVGYTVGATWGDSGGSITKCISVDNSYNYAIQQSDSLCAGMGTGASGGLSFSYTSADNVRDLEGASSSYGATICNGFGIAVDYVTFTAATNPNKKCWGITVSLLCGAEADMHRSESFTTSKLKIWNPFKALLDRIYSN